MLSGSVIASVSIAVFVIIPLSLMPVVAGIMVLRLQEPRPGHDPKPQVCFCCHG
jgi:hypothetical protein